MPALPSSQSFNDSAVTEGQFKTALSSLLSYLSTLLGQTGEAGVALSTLGALFSASVSKAAAYTIAPTDRGKIIEASGAIVLTLSAIATYGPGFCVAIKNVGNSTVTVSATGQNTIDGAASLILLAGESVVIFSNGSAFLTMSKVLRPVSNGLTVRVMKASGMLTIPDGVTKGKLTVVGGGGLAGAGNGGGGGAGGAAIKMLSGLTPGGTLTVVVGAVGGASSVSSGTQAISTVSATAGGNGVDGNANVGSRAGGPGGVGSGGDLNITGQVGQPGTQQTTTVGSVGGPGLSLFAAGPGSGDNPGVVIFEY